MAYHPEPIPTIEDYSSTYGPGFRTKYTEKDSNDFDRTGRHVAALFTYNLAFEVRKLDALQEMNNHFLLRGGGLHSFPFEDPLDFSTAANGRSDPFDVSESSIDMGGIANGSNRVFTCQKKITDSSATYIRVITKPRTGAKFFVNGSEETALALDITTGTVTFTTAPPLGAIVTWQGYYDVEVIYGPQTDIGLIKSYDKYNTGSTESEVQLIEVTPKVPVRDDIPYGGSKDWGELTTDIALSLGEAALHVWTDNVGRDAVLSDPNAIPSGRYHFVLFNEGTTATDIKLPDLTTTLVSVGQDQMARVAILQRDDGSKEYLSVVPAA